MLKKCRNCGEEFNSSAINITKCSDCRHKEYVLELKEKNPNLEILDKFTGKKDKINHKCLKHNYIWPVRCADAIKGVGCKYCKREKLSLSNEEYIKRLKVINPNIEPLEKYVNNRTKIKHKCLVEGCNYEWEPEPSDILEGHGCPKCAGVSKRTHEEYVKELKKIQPTLEVLEKYINKGTPIKHRCTVEGCNYEWKPTPNNLLRGKSKCPRCNNCERYTTESFKAKLKMINPNVEILENYIDSATPIETRCLIDGHIWSVRPGDLIQEYGCPKCGIRNRADKQRLSNKEFLKKVKTVHKDKLVCLEKFIDVKTPIKFKCTKEGCNHEWSATPGNVIYGGTGCPKCANNIRFTTEQFKNIMKIINPNIEIIGEYKNKDEKIKCICKIDRYEWTPSAGNLMHNNSGCPECAIKSRAEALRLTEEEFLEKLNLSNKNNIMIKGEFINVRTKVLVACLECEHEWNANPSDLLYSGSGCPECAAKLVESKLATEVKALIELEFPNTVVKELKGCINPKTNRDLPFDVSFEANGDKYIIEIHGPQHREYIPFFHREGISDLEYQIEKDKLKMEWAIANGYNYKVFWTEEDSIDEVKAFIERIK